MESVNDYIFPYLNPTTFGRIMALQEDRARGLCSEIDFQETILNMLKNENGLSAVKQALNRDFQLNSKITDCGVPREMDSQNTRISSRFVTMLRIPSVSYPAFPKRQYSSGVRYPFEAWSRQRL